MNSTWHNFLAWAKKHFEEWPFARLVGHFLSRSFHGGAESDSEDMDFSTGLLLVLLPIPGAFVSILFYDKYSTFLQLLRRDLILDPYTASLGDEYLFVVVSMVITGIIAVWRWDSILLDRRDFANLVHLPVSAAKLFSANLVAILLLTGLFAFEVNVASAILFPLVVSSSYPEFSIYAGFAAGHSICVSLASIFTFAGVVALIGALIFCLPYRAFRRASQYLRIFLIVFFLSLLMTSFVIAPLLRKLPQNPASPLRFLPPVWFLSLCETLRHPAAPIFHHLGMLALLAAGAATTLAVATYSLSFKRCFLSIPESVDSAVPQSSFMLSSILRVANKFYLRSPALRGCFAFTLQTLTRSEKHFTALGAFVGLGLLLSAQTMMTAPREAPLFSPQFPGPGILSIPLILVYCFVAGLRLVFEVPADLRANWIFKLQLDSAAAETVPLGRSLAWTFLAPFLLLACFPAYLYAWGWSVATLHLAFLFTMTYLLVETMMLRLRKIPFTCSLPLFKEHAFVFVLFLILGFYVFVSASTFLEYLAFLYPFRLIILAFFLGCWWLVLLKYRGNLLEMDRQLIYEEQPVEAVQVLGLENNSYR